MHLPIKLNSFTLKSISKKNFKRPFERYVTFQVQFSNKNMKWVSSKSNKFYSLTISEKRDEEVIQDY